MKFRNLFFPLLILLLSSCGKQDRNPILIGRNVYYEFSALTPEHIYQATDQTLLECQLLVTSIVTIPSEERTFDNTLLEIDDIQALLMRPANPLYLMGSVHPDSIIRIAADSAVMRIELYINDLAINEQLFKAVKSFSQSNEAENLVGWKKRFLDKQLRDFRRNGLELPPAKREKVKKILNSLSRNSQHYYNNISNYSDTLFVDEAEINGLPDAYKNAHRFGDDHYAVDLSYPSFQPFMKLSESNDARRRLLLKYLNRAEADNLPLFRVILRDRKKLADLLGYPSYAAFIVEDKMAKTTENVWAFENELRAALQTKADTELQELLELKTRKTRQLAKSIYQWEKYYYMDQLAKTKYKLDGELVREYFEVGNVIDGLLTTMQELFEMDFKKVERGSTWHPDVLLYEAYDSRTKDWIGSFYLDLFPRENKYGHAACFDVVEGKAYPDGYQKPMFALVCNFPKPNAETPSLLSHSQVETFFHEFGHGLHNLLTKSPLISYSGTRVAQDFVETPSQVYEGWVWKKEVLGKFARHYLTGETIPDDLLNKMLEAKNMLSGINALQQVFYGVLDFTLHDTYNPFSAIKTTEIVEQLQNDITPFKHIPDTHMEASFGHLIGYGAGYYGYLWSKVYARDIYSLFEENGIMDQTTARRYRVIILEKGGTEDAFDLISQFLDREPNNAAFIKSLGL